MRRTLGVITAAAGIAALALTAAPATAATLPAGDAVYVLPCDNAEFNGQLFRVDTATGQATRVGDWVNPDPVVYDCAGPGAYNPVDGLGYWISWADDAGYLISVDLSTGVNTLVGEFTLGGLPHYTPLALAIDAAGNAWATNYDFVADTDVLFSVDLATAALAVVGPTGLPAGSEDYTYGLAWDPITEAVYGYNLFTLDVYTVDTATGAFTVFDGFVYSTLLPYAMAFDSAGQLWGINGDIVSAPLADLDDEEPLTVINPRPGGGADIYSESIIIGPAPAAAPEPELAATGASDSALAAGAAGALILLGGLLLAGARRSDA